MVLLENFFLGREQDVFAVVSVFTKKNTMPPVRLHEE